MRYISAKQLGSAQSLYEKTEKYSVKRINVYMIACCEAIALGTCESLDFIDTLALPQSMRKSVCLMESYHFFYKNNYERAVGILESSLYCNQDTISTKDIYLYLQCALVHYKMGNNSKSQRCIDTAIEIGLPDGFIMPFADFLPSLGDVFKRRIESKRLALFLLYL